MIHFQRLKQMKVYKTYRLDHKDQLIVSSFLNQGELDVEKQEILFIKKKIF